MMVGFSAYEFTVHVALFAEFRKHLDQWNQKKHKKECCIPN